MKNNNENVTTASKQNTPETPVKKVGRPKKNAPKQEVTKAPAKKPGRPKKVTTEQEVPETPVKKAPEQAVPETPEKKPGRPKKAAQKQEASEAPVKETAQKQEASEAPVKETAQKQEASEAPVKETAQKQDVPEKKAPEQAVPTSQDEQESLIREILRNQREMFQAISTLLNKKENEGKEDMKTNNTTAPNPNPTPAPATAPNPGPTSTNPTDRMQSIWNWLKQPFTRPRWVWVCLTILCGLLLIALALSPVPARTPQTTKTTVVAQNGSIAVGGNVTINVTPDRYATKEGTATEMSISRPLISMNYGKEDNTKDTIKLDGVTVVPEQIEVLAPIPET